MILHRVVQEGRLRPAGKLPLNEARLDGLTGRRPFQAGTQIRGSILKMPDISKDSVTRAQISEDEAGQRLDNYLLRICKGVPKSHVYRILRSGEVRVNKKRAEASYRLLNGDEIRIPPVRIAERAPEGDDGAMIRADLPLLSHDLPADFAALRKLMMG